MDLGCAAFGPSFDATSVPISTTPSPSLDGEVFSVSPTIAPASLIPRGSSPSNAKEVSNKAAALTAPGFVSTSWACGGIAAGMMLSGLSSFVLELAATSAHLR